MIRRVSGGYEASIRCHSERVQKTVGFLTLGQLAEALEAALCDPARPWKEYDSYLNPLPDKAGPGAKKKA